MWAKVSTAVAVIVLVTAGVLGFRMVRNQIEADVYRDRLVALNTQHEALRERYNQAVRKTAITELIVGEENVDVHIRTIDGRDQTIKTPANPHEEVYVDYALIDGRLWIRRIYDETTAPKEGMYIDSDLIDIDWDAQGASHGKAIYKRMKPGRYVVTLTASGSLELVACNDCDKIELAAAPEIREFEPLDEAEQRVEGIGVGEVLGRVFGGS